MDNIMRTKFEFEFETEFPTNFQVGKLLFELLLVEKLDFQNSKIYQRIYSHSQKGCPDEKTTILQ